MSLVWGSVAHMGVMFVTPLSSFEQTSGNKPIYLRRSRCCLEFAKIPGPQLLMVWRWSGRPTALPFQGLYLFYRPDPRTESKAHNLHYSLCGDAGDGLR